MSRIIDYSEENIRKIVKVIHSGGVIAFPTETVYALACDATNFKAVENIYKIKNRDINNPLSVMIHDFDQIRSYAMVNGFIEKLVSKFSPGPITYVLQTKQDNGLSNLLMKDDFTGFRIPNHSVALDILSRCQCPLVATSVNFSGEPSAKNMNEISDDLKSQIDLIMDSGDYGNGISSTVIKVSNGSVEMLREGEIGIKEILSAIAK